MSKADLDKKKIDLIVRINWLSDENIIAVLNGVKTSKSKDDWWDELSENMQRIIQNGIYDIENGNVISSDQFWYKLKNVSL